MCAVVDKHTTDVLVDLGIIPDDNVKYITDVHYTYGGKVKKQHYIDLYVFKNGQLQDET